MKFLRYLFACNTVKYDGVRPINIYLMRALYGLMLVVLGQEVWGEILNHAGPWDPEEAVAWCVWAAFSSLSLLGLFHPVKMIPILLLEIFYKILWLVIVALPLWRSDTLAGSDAEDIAVGFMWVLLPIIAVPWGYVVRRYLLGRKLDQAT